MPAISLRTAAFLAHSGPFLNRDETHLDLEVSNTASSSNPHSFMHQATGPNRKVQGGIGLVLLTVQMRHLGKA